MKEKREMWAFKLTPTEKGQLANLSELDGVSMAAVVRGLIKRSHAARVKTFRAIRDREFQTALRRI